MGARNSALRPRWVSPSLIRRSRRACPRSCRRRIWHEDFFGLVEFVDRAFIGLRELRGTADDGGEHGVEVERGIHGPRYHLRGSSAPDRAVAAAAGVAFPQKSI